MPKCTQELCALNATFGWSIGQCLAKLHACEVCKACEYVEVIRYCFGIEDSHVGIIVVGRWPAKYEYCICSAAHKR